MRAVYEPGAFPWISRLESNWTTIRRELDELRAAHAAPGLAQVIPGERKIADDRWKAFMLTFWNHRIESNRRQCPRTAELIDGIPDLTTAFFSILEPGAHIKAHKGPTRAVLRYHLALIVPEPAERCRIRVGSTTHVWREGQSLVFDDTFDHEVWNETTGVRVVLFVDFRRPLPRPIRWLNNGMLKFLSDVVIPRLARYDQMEAIPDRRSRVG